MASADFPKTKSCGSSGKFLLRMDILSSCCKSSAFKCGVLHDSGEGGWRGETNAIQVYLQPSPKIRKVNLLRKYGFRNSMEMHE